MSDITWLGIEQLVCGHRVQVLVQYTVLLLVPFPVPEKNVSCVGPSVVVGFCRRLSSMTLPSFLSRAVSAFVLDLEMDYEKSICYLYVLYLQVRYDTLITYRPSPGVFAINC